MALFKNMAERKRLDDVMDVACSELAPFALAHKDKGDYLILAIDQDIDARVPAEPKVEGGKLVDYPDVFAYADKLLDGWIRDYNVLLKEKGCKKKLSIHAKPRAKLHTELVLELCSDYRIANPYVGPITKTLNVDQIAAIMGHRTARICFQPDGDVYLANIGMFRDFTLRLKKSAFAEEFRYNEATGKSKASREEVIKYCIKLLDVVENGYKKTLEKHGAKYFSINKLTKQYMITLMTNVLCRDFGIEN